MDIAQQAESDSIEFLLQTRELARLITRFVVHPPTQSEADTINQQINTLGTEAQRLFDLNVLKPETLLNIRKAITKVLLRTAAYSIVHHHIHTHSRERN